MQRSPLEPPGSDEADSDWVLISSEDLQKRPKPLEQKTELVRAKILHSLTDLEPLLTDFLHLSAMASGDELSAESNPLLVGYFFNMLKVMKELFKPTPSLLPPEKKDEKAFEELRTKFSENRPIRHLLEHIHQRSGFLKLTPEGIGVDETQFEPEDMQINVVTLNGAWLPEVGFIEDPFIQINKPILRPNRIRANDAVELLKDIIKLKKLHIIFFEEAFDKRTRNFLIEEFQKLGFESIGKEGERLFNAGSGLLGFYNKEFLTLYNCIFQLFPGARIGAEMAAGKGVWGGNFIANVNGKKRAFTVFFTHEMTPGFFNWIEAVQGTMSEVRGRESGDIHFLSGTWAKQNIIDPNTKERIPHLGIIYAGDMNKTMSLPYQLLSISTGKSTGNKNLLLDVKYAGDHNLGLSLLSKSKKDSWCIPKNSKWICDPKTIRSTGKKPVNSTKMIEALLGNFATGTAFPQDILKRNKNGLAELTLQTTENHVIDLLAAEPDEAAIKAFESYVVLTVNKSGKAISDHLMLWAVAVFGRPNAEPSRELVSLADKIPYSLFGSDSRPESRSALEVQTEDDIESTFEFV